MNLKFIRTTLLASAFLAAGLINLSAAETTQEQYEAMSTKMMSAIESGTFEKFIEDGDAGWKGLRKAAFDNIASQIGPRLKTGYELRYLGELQKKRGNETTQTTLWRLIFASGADDMLVTMDVTNGKVSGFGFPRV